eukprot:TRINITY_DN5998_c1_g1_i1.p1 TRINITY_DN5998_c1_g1~~TRINITY_DN5998_c1_g1_i1.p1  ORF type:complete len:564 (+),score=103.33 TRINITY_DN5998_c1_g1_i1:44-1693(+)
MQAFTVLAFAASAYGSSFSNLHTQTVIPKGWVEKGVFNSSKGGGFDVLVGLKRSNVEMVKQIVDTASDPVSPKYLEYASYEEMAKLVSPPQGSVDSVLDWLRASGVSNIFVHPHNDYIHCSASIEALTKATGGHNKFKTFRHNDGREIARMTDGVHIPSHLVDIVETFTGFTGFPIEKGTKPVEKTTLSRGKVNPTVLRQTYNISKRTAAAGARQAIAQFQGENVHDSDLKRFCIDFNNNTDCKISKYIGENDQGGVAGSESMLDTEYLMSIGGVAETWVYSVQSMDFCSDLMYFASNVTSESIYPQVISISYGAQVKNPCGTEIGARFAEDIMKMSTMGITVVIASGDQGSGWQIDSDDNSGTLVPSFPSDIPYCVAVGSTFWISGTSGEQEATKSFGSGGGFSYDYPAADYQKDVIASYLGSTKIPPCNYNKTGRGTPDVAMLGESYTIVEQNVTAVVAGTSASTPAFAGIVTLLNGICGKPLGFINPLMYKNPQMFTDIIVGSNAPKLFKEDGWEAQKGWDAVSGLGTPSFNVMEAVVKAACGKAN